jgi:positive regulator of sigma E activity
METKDVTKAAFMAYGLPLVLFMAGLFSGIALFSNSRYDSISELIGLAFGISLFLITYFLLRRGEIKRDKDQLYQAKIIGYIEEEIWKP